MIPLPIQVEPFDPSDPVIHSDGTITGGAELRALAPKDLAFESEVSRLGPDVKSFCRDFPAADPN